MNDVIIYPVLDSEPYPFWMFWRWGQRRPIAYALAVNQKTGEIKVVNKSRL